MNIWDKLSIIVWSLFIVLAIMAIGIQFHQDFLQDTPFEVQPTNLGGD